MKKSFVIGIVTILLASILVTALSNEDKFIEILNTKLSSEVLKELKTYEKMNPEDAIRMAIENYKNPKPEIKEEINEITSEVTRDIETETPSEEPLPMEILEEPASIEETKEPETKEEQLESSLVTE